MLNKNDSNKAKIRYSGSVNIHDDSIGKTFVKENNHFDYLNPLVSLDSSETVQLQSKLPRRTRYDIPLSQITKKLKEKRIRQYKISFAYSSNTDEKYSDINPKIVSLERLDQVTTNSDHEFVSDKLKPVMSRIVHHLIQEYKKTKPDKHDNNYKDKSLSANTYTLSFSNGDEFEKDVKISKVENPFHSIQPYIVNSYSSNPTLDRKAYIIHSKDDLKITKRHPTSILIKSHRKPNSSKQVKSLQRYHSFKAASLNSEYGKGESVRIICSKNKTLIHPNFVKDTFLFKKTKFIQSLDIDIRKLLDRPVISTCKLSFSEVFHDIKVVDLIFTHSSLIYNIVNQDLFKLSIENILSYRRNIHFIHFDLVENANFHQVDVTTHFNFLFVTSDSETFDHFKRRSSFLDSNYSNDEINNSDVPETGKEKNNKLLASVISTVPDFNIILENDSESLNVATSLKKNSSIKSCNIIRSISQLSDGSSLHQLNFGSVKDIKDESSYSDISNMSDCPICHGDPVICLASEARKSRIENYVNLLEESDGIFVRRLSNNSVDMENLKELLYTFVAKNDAYPSSNIKKRMLISHEALKSKIQINKNEISKLSDNKDEDTNNDLKISLSKHLLSKNDRNDPLPQDFIDNWARKMNTFKIQNNENKNKYVTAKESLKETKSEYLNRDHQLIKIKLAPDVVDPMGLLDYDYKVLRPNYSKSLKSTNPTSSPSPIKQSDDNQEQLQDISVSFGTVERWLKRNRKNLKALPSSVTNDGLSTAVFQPSGYTQISTSDITSEYLMHNKLSTVTPRISTIHSLGRTFSIRNFPMTSRSRSISNVGFKYFNNEDNQEDNKTKTITRDRQLSNESENLAIQLDKKRQLQVALDSEGKKLEKIKQDEIGLENQTEHLQRVRRFSIESQDQQMILFNEIKRLEKERQDKSALDSSEARRLSKKKQDLIALENEARRLEKAKQNEIDLENQAKRLEKVRRLSKVSQDQIVLYNEIGRLEKERQDQIALENEARRLSKEKQDQIASDKKAKRLEKAKQEEIELEMQAKRLERARRLSRESLDQIIFYNELEQIEKDKQDEIALENAKRLEMEKQLKITLDNEAKRLAKERQDQIALDNEARRLEKARQDKIKLDNQTKLLQIALENETRRLAKERQDQIALDNEIKRLEKEKQDQIALENEARRLEKSKQDQAKLLQIAMENESRRLAKERQDQIVLDNEIKRLEKERQDKMALENEARRLEKAKQEQLALENETRRLDKERQDKIALENKIKRLEKDRQDQITLDNEARRLEKAKQDQLALENEARRLDKERQDKIALENKIKRLEKDRQDQIALDNEARRLEKAKQDKIELDNQVKRLEKERKDNDNEIKMDHIKTNLHTEYPGQELEKESNEENMKYRRKTLIGISSLISDNKFNKNGEKNIGIAKYSSDLSNRDQTKQDMDELNKKTNIDESPEYKYNINVLNDMDILKNKYSKDHRSSRASTSFENASDIVKQTGLKEKDRSNKSLEIEPVYVEVESKIVSEVSKSFLKKKRVSKKFVSSISHSSSDKIISSFEKKLKNQYEEVSYKESSTSPSESSSQDTSNDFSDKYRNECPELMRIFNKISLESNRKLMYSLQMKPLPDAYVSERYKMKSSQNLISDSKMNQHLNVKHISLSFLSSAEKERSKETDKRLSGDNINQEQSHDSLERNLHYNQINKPKEYIKDQRDVTKFEDSKDSEDTQQQRLMTNHEINELLDKLKTILSKSEEFLHQLSRIYADLKTPNSTWNGDNVLIPKVAYLLLKNMCNNKDNVTNKVENEIPYIRTLGEICKMLGLSEEENVNKLDYKNKTRPSPNISRLANLLNNDEDLEPNIISDTSVGRKPKTQSNGHLGDLDGALVDKIVRCVLQQLLENNRIILNDDKQSKFDQNNKGDENVVPKRVTLDDTLRYLENKNYASKSVEAHIPNPIPDIINKPKPIGLNSITNKEYGNKKSNLKNKKSPNISSIMEEFLPSESMKLIKKKSLDEKAYNSLMVCDEIVNRMKNLLKDVKKSQKDQRSISSNDVISSRIGHSKLTNSDHSLFSNTENSKLMRSLSANCLNPKPYVSRHTVASIQNMISTPAQKNKIISGTRNVRREVKEKSARVFLNTRARHNMISSNRNESNQIQCKLRTRNPNSRKVFK